jgi:Cysteine-rich secretory protein family
VKLATDWAEKCGFTHQDQATRQKQDIGENLFAEPLPANANAPEAGLAGRVVKNWKSEAEFYDYANNQCKAPKDKGGPWGVGTIPK